ncbi:hypothetical protein [Diaphorobacter nitroreducens]|uniref:hypothetical protein n=2 Tax=Diaphorobacter nitroreducens TaxID=164759 RepID=UPI0028B18D74|nr:hypothetical protein [Diaphorobacter nitroreducens]
MLTFIHIWLTISAEEDSLMKMRHKKRSVLAGLFVLLLVIIISWVVMYFAAENQDAQYRAAVASSQKKSIGALFPWDRVQSTDQPSNANRESVMQMQTNATEEINVGEWMSGMEVPKFPVHEIVSRYKSKSTHTSAEKGELISGLSYCANRRTVGQIAGQQRSRGSVDEANSLLDVHESYLKYCNGLDDSAFSLRKNLLAELAESGHAEAKMMFFEAGPLGRWPTNNEYIPLSSEEIANWNKAAVTYLEQTAKEGDVRSYKSLASMYGASRDDPILGGLSNESTSYAYELLWVSSVQNNPETSNELRESLNNYLSHIVSKFTPDQRREGMKKAAQIQLNLSR